LLCRPILFDNFGPWGNTAIFVVAGALVWRAGARLARLADRIASRTGLGQALLGSVLLGGVTSLPEGAVAVTATLDGAPVLSVNDVLGSAGINVVLLAIADATYGRGALTSAPGRPDVMLQGTLSMALLVLMAAPALTGDHAVFGLGLWSWATLTAYVISITIITRTRGHPGWRPADDRFSPPPQDSDDAGTTSPSRLAIQTVATAMVILFAGFALARSGQVLAEGTGLGISFFGAVLLGFATSLPELSTVLAAVKLKRHEMAIADVFGTNLFNVNIIVLVDALHPGPPVLLQAGPFSAFAAMMCMVLTAVYLVGLLERRDRTFLRMGYDSLAVLFLYVGGLAVLYQLRPQH
jgi:cation:H+ antiporter